MVGNNMCVPGPSVFPSLITADLLLFAYYSRKQFVRLYMLLSHVHAVIPLSYF